MENNIPLSELQEKNKELIKKFPFLLPRDDFTGKVDEDYDYSYTLLDDMPTTWREAFGIQMCEEIETELEKYNFQNEYQVVQIKEKFGGLRWYDNGAPVGSKIDDIIDKYETLSESICFYCGGKAEYVSRGWITYLCKDCFIEHYKDNPDRENLLDKCFIGNKEV